MTTEVKVEQVIGGYIVSYFGDQGRYIREVHVLLGSAMLSAMRVMRATEKAASL